MRPSTLVLPSKPATTGSGKLSHDEWFTWTKRCRSQLQGLQRKLSKSWCHTRGSHCSTGSCNSSAISRWGFISSVCLKNWNLILGFTGHDLRQILAVPWTSSQLTHLQARFQEITSPPPTRCSPRYNTAHNSLLNHNVSFFSYATGVSPRMAMTVRQSSTLDCTEIPRQLLDVSAWKFVHFRIDSPSDFVDPMSSQLALPACSSREISQQLLDRLAQNFSRFMVALKSQYPNDFVDPLNFSLEPPWGFHLRFTWCVLTIIEWITFVHTLMPHGFSSHDELVNL